MGVSDKTKLRKEKLKNKATTDLLNVLGFRLDDHCNIIDKDGNPVAVGADNRPLILHQMAKNLGIDPSVSPVIAQNENGKRPRQQLHWPLLLPKRPLCHRPNWRWKSSLSM
jgi:hypothetical protein